MPKYSILLPTHNRADVIGYAIESCLWQTDSDFEALVVGDGCTDNTAEVVQSYDDDRIIWYDLPKAPFFGYANRNIALNDAKGKYIAFLGHDNVLFPDHLELMGNFMDKHQVEIAHSRPLWVDREGQIYPGLGSLHFPASLKAFFEEGTWIPATPWVFHRDCLEKYGAWSEELQRGGDWEFQKRYIDGGNRENFAYLPIPTNLHFQAIWRTKKNFGAFRLKAMESLFADDQFNLSSFKIDIPDSITEQQAYFEFIRDNPNWIQQLRVDCETLIDRLAELYVYEAVVFKKRFPLVWKLLQALTSKGWLRKVRRFIAPEGSRREQIWMRIKGESKAFEISSGKDQ